MKALAHCIGLVLWITVGAAGCATMRDTAEGMESGASLVLAAPPDSAWAAVVTVMRDYPIESADKTKGVFITRWNEQVVAPEAFGRRVLKERTRFEIAVTARDQGSRIRVRQDVELLTAAYPDPAETGQKALCQYPWAESVVSGSQSSRLYNTNVCSLDNPWDEPRGVAHYVWKDVSQVGVSTKIDEQEKAILGAIENAVNQDATGREQSPATR